MINTMVDLGERQWSFHVGDTVYGCGDHKLGRVKAVTPTHLVVEKGFLLHTDYYVPLRAVANVEGGTIYLDLTRDEALHRGWDRPPADERTAQTG